MKLRHRLTGVWIRFKRRRGWAARGRSGPAKAGIEGAVTMAGELNIRTFRLTPKSRIVYEGLSLVDKAAAKHYLDHRAEYVEDPSGRREGKRCVTNAGVAFLVDAFQNIVEIEDMKYHDSGTGTNAENATDTALQTPTGVARVVGSQIEGASANIYKSVATITYDGTYSVTEWGLFSAAAAGTLWDRDVFASVGVDSGDKIEFSYELTCNAGG